MEQFNRVLLCTDDVARDARFFNYVRYIAGVSKTKRLDILNILYDFTSTMYLPMHMSVDGIDHLALPTKSDRETVVKEEQAKAEQYAQEYFSSLSEMECHCQTIYGSYLNEPLRFAYDNKVDLIILSAGFGMPHNKGAKALYARRIARRSTCSLLVIPDGTPAETNTILAPIRDSSVSEHALNTACGLAAAMNAEIVPLNVYQLDGGYSYSSASPQEHQKMLEEWAQRECSNLVGRLMPTTVPINSICIADPNDAPVDVINETATKMSAQMIVIGARGRTGAAGVLLGTVTEQLIRKSRIPVLAVKRKGECIGVLEAIFSIAGGGDPDINFG